MLPTQVSYNPTIAFSPCVRPGVRRNHDVEPVSPPHLISRPRARHHTPRKTYPHHSLNSLSNKSPQMPPPPAPDGQWSVTVYPLLEMPPNDGNLSVQDQVRDLAARGVIQARLQELLAASPGAAVIPTIIYASDPPPPQGGPARGSKRAKRSGAREPTPAGQSSRAAPSEQPATPAAVHRLPPRVLDLISTHAGLPAPPLGAVCRAWRHAVLGAPRVRRAAYADNVVVDVRRAACAGAEEAQGLVAAELERALARAQEAYVGENSGVRHVRPCCPLHPEGLDEPGWVVPVLGQMQFAQVVDYLSLRAGLDQCPVAEAM
ncbi:hypothetical protein BC834DRAFT_82454 [Gloeopeniophorella convolvens]|nr:hypothetical protein BC834DRAFT_82454 [Gloeopeniophorella convolvens]